MIFIIYMSTKKLKYKRLREKQISREYNLSQKYKGRNS